ncbi:MAG: sugar ABC transporter permease [Thermomicrobiales bacterium]|nr:sugar ABC transporter permease [Thermomicrobiales bacterium]
MLVLPAILIVLALAIYPLVYSLWLAFHQWDLQTPGHPFVGLDNFSGALGDDRVWVALKNTGVIVTVGIFFEFIVGLGLALLLVDTVHIRRILLPIVMLPVTMVPIVVGLTWRMMWDNQYGVVNALLRIPFGNDLNIVWLGQTRTAIIAMIVTQVWQWTPFMFLIMLAALSSVNPDLYEASALDGAGWGRQLLDITLPAIRPIIVVAVLFRALDAFKIFDLVYMFTQGGPGTSTETISWYIYQVGFKFFRMGYAAAVSYLVLILLSILATLYVAAFVRGREA